MWRNGCGDEIETVEPECLADFLRAAQVSPVDRIESAAEQTDLHEAATNGRKDEG